LLAGRIITILMMILPFLNHQGHHDSCFIPFFALKKAKKIFRSTY